MCRVPRPVLDRVDGDDLAHPPGCGSGRRAADDERAGFVSRVATVTPSDQRPAQIALIQLQHSQPPLPAHVKPDQPLVRQVIAAYVAADGHTVIDVASAAKAIEILRHEPVDLLLADWAMPGMSGDQLAAAAKREHPDLPVVLVTGFGDLANAAGEVIPGVDAIVGKPLTRDKLRRALSHVQPRYDSASRTPEDRSPR